MTKQLSKTRKLKRTSKKQRGGAAAAGKSKFTIDVDTIHNIYLQKH